MSEKEVKKRKRQSNGVATPNKKVAVESSNGAPVNITWKNADGLHPVLASTPGLTAPSIPFDAFTKARSSKKESAPTPSSHDVLLHSSDHPKLDYLASPYVPDDLSHYVAVFDPQSNTLEIASAHHLSLRSTLRSELEELDRSETRRSIMQQREDLGREFGTKKAKKVIADRTVNAIGRDAKGKGGVDEVQTAILESLDSATANDLSKAQLEQALLDAKPIPKPNLTADSVEAVYPLKTLIPSHDLRLVQVKDWQDELEETKDIKTKHRYTATRAIALASDDNLTERLKALRYVELLLDFRDSLQQAGKSGKKVPKKETLTKRLADWSPQLIDSVRQRFSDRNNELSKWHMDNLHTHMCALSLFIDGYSTNTTDLKDDLKLDNKQMSQYYLEIGCKVNNPTEKERESMKLNKAAAAVTRIAKLKLPLEFPKPRSGRRR